MRCGELQRRWQLWRRKQVSTAAFGRLASWLLDCISIDNKISCPVVATVVAISTAVIAARKHSRGRMWTKNTGSLSFVDSDQIRWCAMSENVSLVCIDFASNRHATHIMTAKNASAWIRSENKLCDPCRSVHWETMNPNSIYEYFTSNSIIFVARKMSYG